LPGGSIIFGEKKNSIFSEKETGSQSNSKMDKFSQLKNLANQLSTLCTKPQSCTVATQTDETSNSYNLKSEYEIVKHHLRLMAGLWKQSLQKTIDEECTPPFQDMSPLQKRKREAEQDPDEETNVQETIVINPGEQHPVKKVRMASEIMQDIVNEDTYYDDAEPDESGPEDDVSVTYSQFIAGKEILPISTLTTPSVEEYKVIFDQDINDYLKEEYRLVERRNCIFLCHQDQKGKFEKNELNHMLVDKNESYMQAEQRLKKSRHPIVSSTFRTLLIKKMSQRDHTIVRTAEKRYQNCTNLEIFYKFKKPNCPNQNFRSFRCN